MPKPRPTADPNHTATWTKYKSGLCRTCHATCCTMPVEVGLDDLRHMELITPFEAETAAPKAIAQRLKQAGFIEHFNHSSAKFTLARRPNNDCVFLHPTTRLCTIYAQRPHVCRAHPHEGPRPGYCAYVEVKSEK
ncbi:MAG: YkgJ family cysteine cluster protein [Chloroflexi bacterium]|nr:YkgJ family cysteine cluster protein [Chloroflexota bacterium]